MTIHPIIRYPDPRLALPAQPVIMFDGALRDLASDLLETMHAAPGIGITAPHIGVAKLSHVPNASQDDIASAPVSGHSSKRAFIVGRPATRAGRNSIRARSDCSDFFITHS